MHFHASNCPKNVIDAPRQLCIISCFSTFSPQKQMHLIPGAQKKPHFRPKKFQKVF